MTTTSTLPRAGRPPRVEYEFERRGYDIAVLKVKGEEFRFRLAYNFDDGTTRYYPLGARAKRQSPNFDYALARVKFGI